MKHLLINTWQLESFELRREDGTIVYPFGKDPIGRLIYTDAGHFAVQLMKRERIVFASGDQLRGTPTEIEASFQSVVAYYGRYSFDELGHTVTHEVEGSLFPNWIGQSLKRRATFETDRLELSTEPTSFDGLNSVGVLTWRVQVGK